MGHSSCRRNVLIFLSALKVVLKAEKFEVRPGGIDAAAAVYEEK